MQLINTNYKNLLCFSFANNYKLFAMRSTILSDFNKRDTTILNNLYVCPELIPNTITYRAYFFINIITITFGYEPTNKPIYALTDNILTKSVKLLESYYTNKKHAFIFYICIPALIISGAIMNMCFIYTHDFGNIKKIIMLFLCSIIIITCIVLDYFIYFSKHGEIINNIIWGYILIIILMSYIFYEQYKTFKDTTINDAFEINFSIGWFSWSIIFILIFLINLYFANRYSLISYLYNDKDMSESEKKEILKQILVLYKKQNNIS